MPYEMDFKTLFDEISVYFNPTPSRGEVELAVNGALRIINSFMTPEKKIITITGESAITIGEMTTAKISELTDYKIKEYTRFGAEFVYNSDDYSLHLDESITNVMEVILDDELWTPYDYPTVKDSDNSDAKIYHFNGRHIYFPKDISASDEVIKLKVEMFFPEIEENLILVPTIYKEALVSGAKYNLMEIPKYRDTSKYGIYLKNAEKRFFSEMQRIEDKNFDLEPIETQSKNYFYKKYDTKAED